MGWRLQFGLSYGGGAVKHEAIGYTGAGKGSLKSYLSGFFYALVLTVIPFALVKYAVFPKPFLLTGIVLAAVVQIGVHLHYFLHLDASSEERWNLLALMFTVFIMFILIGGSVWIMINLHYRMA